MKVMVDKDLLTKMDEKIQTIRKAALQLKEIVVEEQALCSKSSFYRLLEEIEQEPEIGVVKKGKEKHYITNISKKNY